MVQAKTIFSVVRDILLFCGLIYLVSLWQERNLLDDDGSVLIENRSLPSIEGQVEPVLADNKRTLVYFFAPWCNVCAASIDNLDGLEDKDLKVVRIALDYSSVEEVEKFVTDNKVVGTVLLGTQTMVREFNVMGYPTYYLLDEQHRVVANAFGYSTEVGLKLTNYLNKS